MAIVITNGTIVTSADEYRADILIEGEKIAALGKDLYTGAETMVDAAGKYVFPGGIDGHTHFNSFSMGTATAGFETAVGAMMGGTTCVIDFTPQPQGMSLVEAVAFHRENSAQGRSAVDFGLHSMVQDSRESIFDELPALVEAGVPSIKLFMAYKGTPSFSGDDVIFRILQKAREVGMLVMVHAENAEIIDVLQKQLVLDKRTEPRCHALSRPPVAEGEAVFRAAMLAKAAEAPLFIVHVTCLEALASLRAAREQGVRILAETCPHYLTLDVTALARPGFEGAKYVCSPPLRETRHQDPLWQALREGLLHVVGSDHCGLNFKGQKDLGRHDFTKIPNGCPGVQDRLALLYTYGVEAGKLSLSKMVELFSTAPAKIYGLYPQKGSLAIGADADIVIFDPAWRGTIRNETSHQGLDFNAFEGLGQTGRVEKVFLRGSLCVDQGDFVGDPGQGRFVRRAPYGSAYDGRGSR